MWDTAALYAVDARGYAHIAYFSYTGGDLKYVTNAPPFSGTTATLYADLGAYGIWKHDGTQWSFLAPENPEQIVASGTDLYADLGSYGIWKYSSSSWSKLAPENPEQLAVFGSSLYADLGSLGIWKYNGSSWTFLAPENPEQIVASGTDLYADLGSYGIWKYNGSSWSNLPPRTRNNLPYPDLLSMQILAPMVSGNTMVPPGCS